MAYLDLQVAWDLNLVFGVQTLSREDGCLGTPRTLEATVRHGGDPPFF